MIAWFLRLLHWRQRKHCVTLAAAVAEQLSRTRPKSQTRRDQMGILRRTAASFAQRALDPKADLPALERSIEATRAAGEMLVAEERELEQRLSAAERQAQELILKANRYPGQKFHAGLQRKRETLRTEINRFWRVRHSNEEAFILRNIDEQIAALGKSVAEAGRVRSDLLSLQQRIEAIPKQQVDLEIGTAELYQAALAVFKQARAESEKGSYSSAAHRLSEVNARLETLMHRLEERVRRVRREIDLWEGTSVEKRFPEILQFPKALSAEDVERWYAMRDKIDAFVLERADEQRLRNIPKAFPSRYPLPKRHPLRTPLAEAKDATKLDAFLHGVRIFGR